MFHRVEFSDLLILFLCSFLPKSKYFLSSLRVVFILTTKETHAGGSEQRAAKLFKISKHSMDIKKYFNGYFSDCKDS